MRHRVAGRKLTRDSQHRIALRRNLVRALLINGRITTTLAKAKAVRPYVEKLVTRAKKAAAMRDSDRAGYVHQVRLLAREVPDRKLLSLLVDVIEPSVVEDASVHLDVELLPAGGRSVGTRLHAQTRGIGVGTGQTER